MQTSKRNGFTLIEMLFVVAILGVLTTIGISYIQKQNEQLKIHKTAAQMQQILQSAANYYVDNGIWPPQPINKNTLPPGFKPYLPYNLYQMLNPWGYPYQYTYISIPNSKKTKLELTTKTSNYAAAKQLSDLLASTMPIKKTPPFITKTQIVPPKLLTTKGEKYKLGGIGNNLNNNETATAICPGTKKVTFFVTPNNLNMQPYGQLTSNVCLFHSIDKFSINCTPITKSGELTTCPINITLNNGTLQASYVALCGDVSS